MTCPKPGCPSFTLTDKYRFKSLRLYDQPHPPRTALTLESSLLQPQARVCTWRTSQKEEAQHDPFDGEIGIRCPTQPPRLCRSRCTGALFCTATCNSVLAAVPSFSRGSSCFIPTPEGSSTSCSNKHLNLGYGCWNQRPHVLGSCLWESKTYLAPPNPLPCINPELQWGNPASRRKSQGGRGEARKSCGHCVPTVQDSGQLEDGQLEDGQLEDEQLEESIIEKHGSPPSLTGLNSQTRHLSTVIVICLNF